MWNHANQELPYVFTFNEKFSHIRQKFRDQALIGGLTTVPHRHFDLSGGESPLAARIVPNGDELTLVMVVDFNRLF